jgi:hypothetical protein
LFLTLLFFVTSLSPVNVTANTDFQSFNDSIRKYKLTNPQKALDFAFEALDASYYAISSHELVFRIRLGETDKTTKTGPEPQE